MRNFPTEFWKRFQDYKEAPALVTIEADSVATLTFWEWTRRVQNIATALMEEGFEPGTRMGLVAPNRRDFLDLAVAVWLIGGCVVPLVPGRDRRETLRCLGRSGCDWIALEDERERERLRGSGNLPPQLQWVFFEGEAPGEKDFLVADLHEAGRTLIRRGRTKQLAERIYGLKPGDPALILFDPEPAEGAQGAFFSGEKLSYQLDAIAQQMDFGGSDQVVLAAAMSFGWFSSFLITVAALYAGKTVALASSLRELSDEMGRLRPTHLVCGPAYLAKLSMKWRDRLDEAPDMLKRLAGESGDDEADSSTVIRTLGSLGSVGERLARRFLYDPIVEEFGGRLQAIQVFEGRAPDGVNAILEKAGIALLGHFGIAEAGISHIEHPGARRPETVGRPIEGVATKIDGAKTGKAGELCLRGETLFDGYWAEEGLRVVDEKGWLHTGRQGRINSGFLFLVD